MDMYRTSQILRGDEIAEYLNSEYTEGYHLKQILNHSTQSVPVAGEMGKSMNVQLFTVLTVKGAS